MVTAMSPHLDIYPLDKCSQSGKRIHGSNIATHQHYSYGVRHSIGYVVPGLVDASVSGGFISIDPILLLGQSVRTSTMPDCFCCSATEPNPHSFIAFTASMSQKAHLGTRDAVDCSLSTRT